MPYKNIEDKRRAWREHYHRNKVNYISRQREKRQEIREWLRDLKEGVECQKCGESDPACLTFHHREPDEKEFTISFAINQRLSRKRILAEMEKCDVLCANCHMKHHFGL